MFRNDKLIKPSPAQIGFTALVAVIGGLSAHASPVVGYALAVGLVIPFTISVLIEDGIAGIWALLTR
ncbi:hypothetical protein A3742_14450 [Oleiphilus sp. HI0071]|uniref:hypothetical protein n=1 Tax=unclassified Oleiphilus TaxID=2631174 RepID=UPI0007C3BF5A|nr:MULTISPECIES: hypothetical protein [unclassified Oleiphilus]KZY61695.1 hypothetical protein A3737_05595 [Oleiphilus sp. HI0065]KZY79255.1 hypothetical protein A3742_14450 [Oleiphilus sp. HI0071]KZY92519.1 hypothetical protein A3744_02100 [Oleiphilus sp. HI0073]KZZ40361.1 hypothetical protein A3758_24225 [Oleiphilus sp. HI0118]KZZ55605.1 hypothetical protein A3760_31800 [Oleiphilus sp. HI0122]KZZ65117.1 hypothetical protein A3765_06230 [Oleiphilus sp. HI0130]KZZ82418.1 hypothetical protein